VILMDMYVFDEVVNNIHYAVVEDKKPEVITQAVVSGSNSKSGKDYILNVVVDGIYRFVADSVYMVDEENVGFYFNKKLVAVIPSKSVIKVLKGKDSNGGWVVYSKDDWIN